MTKFIYFAQGRTGGPIKIGVSSNPTRRVQQLSSSSPEPIRLIAMFPESRNYSEWRIHHRIIPLTQAASR